jgi:hypothetical protein
MLGIFCDGRLFIFSNLTLVTDLLFFNSRFMFSQQLACRGQRQIFRGGQLMPADASIVKNLMKQNLLGVFNERDAGRRRSAIGKLWDAKGIFIDPEGRYVGHAAINDAAEQLQNRFPNSVFSELADGDANSGVGRLPWSFGPPDDPRKITGIDVLAASDDGRITSIYTFVDAVKG